MTLSKWRGVCVTYDTISVTLTLTTVTECTGKHFQLITRKHGGALAARDTLQPRSVRVQMASVLVDTCRLLFDADVTRIPLPPTLPPQVFSMHGCIYRHLHVTSCTAWQCLMGTATQLHSSFAFWQCHTRIPLLLQNSYGTDCAMESKNRPETHSHLNLHIQ